MALPAPVPPFALAPAPLLPHLPRIPRFAHGSAVRKVMLLTLLLNFLVRLQCLNNRCLAVYADGLSIQVSQSVTANTRGCLLYFLVLLPAPSRRVFMEQAQQDDSELSEGRG